MITARAAKQVAERRNRDPEVMAAAIKVFHSKGFAAATVQDVADEVGVLKGSLYHYISSKEDLLFRVLKESHDQAAGIMAEVTALDVAPLERLRAYLQKMHLWYLNNHERASVYLNQSRHLTGANREEVRTQARNLEHFLRELLAEARGSGALRQDLDLRLAAYFLLGALNSLPNWYRPDRGYSPETIATTYTEMALRSLLPDPPAAKAPAKAARTPAKPANSAKPARARRS